ncbi:MAG: antirestriction protein ArdA [Oscillospiraceae bacterium]
MQFHAILSNPAHPEYGVATIPFPLSREEYDHSMEVLSALEIGDAVRQDCKVDELTDCYPVLKRLEGQIVNGDELDYLAKRLDSFWGDEGSQFQAMAEKLDLTDIKDFINLTFCCQQATVITDFSNLEQIGKNHYMNLNGGCASTEELDNLDGEETARLLIDSGAGVVTPYGVVYDNGMKLEPLYRGGVFPPYLYDAYPLVLEASPLSEPEDTKNMTLLCLPMTEKQIEHALVRGGIDSVEQMRFKPDLILLQELSILLTLEQESLSDLNEMCEAIMPLAHNDLPKLGAVITFAKPQDATQVKHLAENLELFDFIPKVKTPAEYGRYMIEESGHFEYDPNLEDFYDFDGYARQRMRQEQGQFVEGGYISYQGLQSMDEVMAGSPTLDDGFQMGGMQ